MPHTPVAVYVLQAKIDPETIGELYSLIEASRSEAAAVQLTLCPKVADADVIITNVRMRKRLERHLDWKIAVCDIHHPGDVSADPFRNDSNKRHSSPRNGFGTPSSESG